MNTWAFTAEEAEKRERVEIAIPFFEDARKDFAPNYASRSTLVDAEARVMKEMKKLNAFVTAMERGVFSVGEHSRHGYLIQFVLENAPGVIRVAGLPMRFPSKEKEAKVRVQCLLNVADWLKAAVTQQVFSPDASPLIPFLLLRDGRTVAEVVISGKFMLPEGE